ncbi:NUDIX hydrolase [Achromobacter insolitus]|uniref:NUDIX hydrolase n=2 Tax=Achromobacter insolitus TaxID=217204 RepID=UPI0038BDCB50
MSPGMRSWRSPFRVNFVSIAMRAQLDQTKDGQASREPRLGCGAAVVNDGRLLLIHRRREPEADHWGLPGGKVDWLEPVEHAIRREIREELGISLGELHLLCVVDQIDPSRATHWAAPVFLTLQFEGTPALIEPDKHAAWGWFALDRLPEPLTMATRTAALHLRQRFASAH